MSKSVDCTQVDEIPPRFRVSCTGELGEHGTSDQNYTFEMKHFSALSCPHSRPPKTNSMHDMERPWSFIFDSKTWKTMVHSTSARRSFRFPSAYIDDVNSYVDNEDLGDSTKAGLGAKKSNLNGSQIAILASMCILYMASSTTSSSLGILLPDLQQTFVDVDNNELGVMASMVTLGYAVVQPFSGLVVLTLGPWKTVVISCVLSMTGNLGFGLSTTSQGADLFRLWTGLGCGMVYGIVWWFIKSEIPPSKFGMLSGILEASNAFGTVIATIPLYYFQKSVEWQLFFTAFLPIMVLCGGSVAAYLLLPYTPKVELIPDRSSSVMVKDASSITLETEIENAPSDMEIIPLSELPSPSKYRGILEKESSSGDEMMEVELEECSKRGSRSQCSTSSSLDDRSVQSSCSSVSEIYLSRSRSAWEQWKTSSIEILSARNEWGAFSVAFIVMGTMDSLGFVWLITLLKSLHNLDENQAAICVMVSNFSVMPVIFSVGVLSDFVQLRLPFVYTGICISMLHLLLLGMAKLSYPAAIIVSALNGISQGFTSTAYAFAAERLSAKHTEQAVAWNQLFYMGGVTFMTFILGVMMSSHEDESASSDDINAEKRVCIILFVIICVSIVPCLMLKETHGKFQIA